MKWNKEQLSKYSDVNRKSIEKTLEKYVDNKWWEFEDKAEMAKWQIFEEILMVDFSDFHEGIESLIGHSVLMLKGDINERICM